MLIKQFETEKRLISDISSNKPFSMVTYAVLCVVATVMTVLNIITDKGFLTLCTGIFAFLCVVNIVLSLISKTCEQVAKMLFAVEVLCMFTFFLVSGNPDGFSAIWICMLPSLGMIFFNRNRGTALCVAMFLILIFFLWIPYGQSLLLYDYTSTFKMRFPVLFLAFDIMAFFLETLRINAIKEMKRMEEHYRDLSVRDQLTRVFNRQGMYSVLEKNVQYANAQKIGVAMFDIDDFKNINDKYGHNAGDVVLMKFAEILKLGLNAVVCRWGGEEFIAVFWDGGVSFEDLERVRKDFESYEFSSKDIKFNVTSSIGVCKTDKYDIESIDSLIDNADKAMYRAKQTGKNRIVFYEDL